MEREPAHLETNQRAVLPTLKEYAFFAPAIGGALAIAFDIGFFYGLNSGFFSVFSLSEHLVFAFGATPYAVLFLILGAIEWALVTRARRHTSIAAIRKNLIIFPLLISLILLSAFEVWRREYLLAMSMGAIAAAFIPVYFIEEKYRWQFSLFFASPIFGLCLSFMLGVQIAHGLISDNTKQKSKIEMEDGSILEGRLVRLGDRGILFYYPDRKIFALVPWNKIKNAENSLGD